MSLVLKCRKCRHELVRETSSHTFLLSAHGEKQSAQPSDTQCSGDEQSRLWFLEDTASSWISEKISEFEWTKGKLNCPKCETRIGTFDFVSRLKCACGSAVLPAVQIVKSKVDSVILSPSN